MNEDRHDRYSLILLVSLIIFLILSAFVSEHHVLGDVVLAVSIYGTLVIGTLELSQKRNWRWPGTLLAGISMTIMVVHFFYPVHLLMVANWIFLAAFLGFVSVALVCCLGRPGSVTSGGV